jgi:capsular exopolysaccharide synthesis family protein
MIWPFDSRTKPTLPPRVGAPGEIVVLVDNVVDSRLVVYHDPNSYQAEQYRGFRTNIRAMNPKDEPRTLLFTSAQPREGKSITVANIALALAENQHLKVCLVDADLRAGSVSRLFGVRDAPGLADVMLDRVSPRLALQESRLPGLNLMTAGRPVDNPGEVLSSDHMQELIGWLKRSHNYVLFDSPPCLPFADSAQLSQFIDGVLLVVAIDETRRKDAERAITALTAAGANVVGTFVTGALPLDRPVGGTESEDALDASAPG